jgi:hypothetical protein
MAALGGEGARDATVHFGTAPRYKLASLSVRSTFINLLQTKLLERSRFQISATLPIILQIVA